MAECRSCDDPLHLAAIGDEYVYVDAQGSPTGADADMRRFGDDPHGAIGALYRRIRGHQTARHGTMTDDEYRRDMSLYAAVNWRMNGGTWHTHYPATLPVHDWGRVPEHCGRPMHRRPSGWHCRSCEARHG